MLEAVVLEAVSIVSVIIMALIPIFLGAFRSVKHQDEQKAAGEQVMAGMEILPFCLWRKAYLCRAQ